ncbi:amidase, partial [Actinomadura adrarensis]
MLGLAEQAALLAQGEVSSEELVGEALRRIDERRSLGAFRVVRDAAVLEARAADKRLKDGERLPLLGVPV